MIPPPLVGVTSTIETLPGGVESPLLSVSHEKKKIDKMDIGISFLYIVFILITILDFELS
jgi:hypothetical protein